MEKNGGPASADPQLNRHSTPIPGCAALDRVRIVLCQPRHPGNIGAVARAMKTMGLSRLYLVAPERFSADDPDPEALRRASGAVDVLEAAKFCASLEEALTGVVFAAALSARARDLGPPAAPARAAAKTLVARAADGEVALVFGGETSGLTNEQVMRCDCLVSIPANPEYSSLNLGAAVQLLSYELRQAAQGDRGELPVATPFSSPPATRDEIERLFAHFEKTMLATGFVNPAQPSRLLPKLRRLFGRSGLERDEVNILRGFLASVDALQQK